MHLLYQAASAAASPKYNKITTFSSAPRFSLRLSSTGNHPRNNANAIRKYHRALSRGFPQFSRKYFIIQRQHKGQRDDNKFISAEAVHEIAERNDLPKKFCEVKDHNVSHLMAQGVVYLFQIIQEFLFFYFRSFFSRYRKNPTFRIIPTIVEIGAARPILVRLALGWILMK